MAQTDKHLTVAYIHHGKTTGVSNSIPTWTHEIKPCLRSVGEHCVTQNLLKL